MFNTFRKSPASRAFLMSLVITGLGYGLYKGILDNYLAEIVSMGRFDRGVLEFFRETPGLFLIFILASLYMLSAETLYKTGAVFMLIGMGMLSIVPRGKVLVTLFICVYSLGEHIQLGMKNTLTLQYSVPGKEGRALGYQNSFYQTGTLFGYLFVIPLFLFLGKEESLYRKIFFISAVLFLISFLLSLLITGKSETDETKRRFYFRKKFTKYYMLEVFYGARKQVFFTFGPYVLILFYGAGAGTISLLFALSAISAALLSPCVGRLIDRLGYKIIMVSDTLILVIVCFFYGFSHHIFPKDIAFSVCCVNYILDSVISLASMASNVYVRDISDSPEETRATISTGISVNHLITVFIALFGGYIWEKLGIETLFMLSAFLGLMNSAYAMTIREKQPLEEG